MSMISQRVIRPAEQQLEVGNFLGSGVDDNGVCREISQALIFWGKRATDAAYRVEGRQQINDPHKVSDHNLRPPQPESFGVDHTDSKHPFSESLSAPGPLKKNRISNGDNKIADGSGCEGKV